VLREKYPVSTEGATTIGAWQTAIYDGEDVIQITFPTGTADASEEDKPKAVYALGATMVNKLMHSYDKETDKTHCGIDESIVMWLGVVGSQTSCPDCMRAIEEAKRGDDDV